MSFPKTFPHADHSALLGRAFNADQYRTMFPDQWSGFLKAHFRGDPALIAVFFDVTPRTAENWLTGISRPTGDRVALAATADPAAFAAHIGPSIAA